MSKWYRHARFWPYSAITHFRRTGGRAAVWLAVLALLPWGTEVAHGEGNPKPKGTGDASVLVATRNLSPADHSAQRDYVEESNAESTTPVAESSDGVPELATSADEDGRPPQSRRPRRTNATSGGFSSLKQMQDTSGDQTETSLEPVKFQGIMVGETSKRQLLQEWGDPADTVATAEGNVFAFAIDPFQSVEVLVGEGDVVAAIKIALAAPLDAKQLAEQLSLADVRSVTALDDADEPLGMAFPERGVIFMYDASEAAAADDESAPVVSHVVIQQLDPLAFAMRAESSLHGDYAKNIDDLKTAIRLDPQCAHAHSLLAKIYLATGQADQAASAAQAACDADPENASYQLIRGRALAMRGQYDDAVLTVRAVLDRENLAPIDKSQALHQMGQLASLGDVEIASKAISFHTRAIEVADTLATGTNGKERRAAKQILVEAHLAIGEEVARQAFDQKVDNLSLWVGRASGIAEEFIAHDGGSKELRLHVAQRALSALASFRPTLDPGPWVQEADEAAQSLFSESGDELWQARVKWELGLAYLNALRVEHVRRETENALRYGQRAVEYLAQGAKTRQAVHSSEQQIGLLYFQMGAVQAVHQLDHAKAAKWYDKAEPLLTSPQPKSELFAPRREGEMLVSMGVTYWQIGEKDRAVDVTQKGVKLVEEAVEAGILAKSTLGVPYGNLATMYEKLGEDSSAAKYSAMARSITGSSGPPRVGRMPGVRQASSAAKAGARRPRNVRNFR